MSASAQRSLAAEITGVGNGRANRAAREVANEAFEKEAIKVAPEDKLKVAVAAENRLLRETLARMLKKKGNIEVSGEKLDTASHGDWLTQTKADVLLLTSCGTLHEDLQTIAQVRGAAPAMRILLLGRAKNEVEFLQCVRAGISGYLLHDASSQEVIEGVAAVHAGEAICPRRLCTALFRYMEGEGALTACGSPRRRLGLTRREQQLVPLIAKGLTNKEIANHFSLSEQTVKNHVYRMKQKTGAEDRLDIVQLYRVQGFLV